MIQQRRQFLRWHGVSLTVSILKHQMTLSTPKFMGGARGLGFAISPVSVEVNNVVVTRVGGELLL